MRRVVTRLSVLGTLALLASTGCATSSTDTWRWPWQKPSMLGEHYELPPHSDTRYSEPPTLPKSVMAPSIQKKDAADPKRPQGMTAPGMMPGMSGRPSGAGSMMY